MSRFPIALLATAALIGALVAMATRPPVPKDSAAGTIAGRVVYATTGRPVVGVTVFARSAADQGEVGAPEPNAARWRRAISTDALGQFRIGSVPPGAYFVQIEHPRVFGAVGQLRPGAAAEPVLVGTAPDERPTELLVPAWPGAAISGAVRDAADRPWPHAELRIVPTGREADWTSVRTDPQGGYRAGSLWPGEYRVVVPVIRLSAGARAPLAATASRTPVSTFAPDAVEPSSARRIALGLGEHQRGVDVHVQSVWPAQLQVEIEADPVAGTFFRLRLWRNPELDRLELADARLDLPDPAQVVVRDLPRASYTLEVERLVDGTEAVAYWPVRVPVDLRSGDAAAHVRFGEDAPLDTTVQVEATMARQVTIVSGVVRDPLPLMHPQPDPLGVAVLAFPVAREQWLDPGRGPDRLASQRADATGAFEIVGLPAGEYFVTAVPATRLEAWPLPYMLARLARAARRLELGPGERRQLDLELK